MTIALERGGTMTKIVDLANRFDGWAASNRELLRQSLRLSSYRDMALALFDEATSRPTLIDCLVASAEVPAKALGALPERILRSSEMGVPGRSWERILGLVKAVGGTRYVSAHGGANYMDHEEFERQGVSVEYMDYSVAPWPQAYGDFTPYVTVLDLIAATGSDAQNYLHPRTVPWRMFLDRMHGVAG